MNAVRELAEHLDRVALQRLLRVKKEEQEERSPGLSSAETTALRRRLVSRSRGSLAAFLNRLKKDELEAMCRAEKLDAKGSVGELRSRLWILGAQIEAGGDEQLGTPWQPIPILLSGRLVYQGPLRGSCPPSPDWPRPIPEPAPWPGAKHEPESLEELLSNADELLGLRLGTRGADKGIYGTRIAQLLGAIERGLAEPDWRGEVEIKTVPVVKDPVGWWRVKEDPAISMEQVDPWIKLRKVLWIARVGGPGDSPILSWYYQELDATTSALAARYLHQRPKGGKGSTAKGWYLQKRYFLYSGFLKSLNG